MGSVEGILKRYWAELIGLSAHLMASILLIRVSAAGRDQLVWCNALASRWHFGSVFVLFFSFCVYNIWPVISRQPSEAVNFPLLKDNFTEFSSFFTVVVN